MAKARPLDFSKVKDRGDFNPKHQMPGDYRGKVTSVKDGKTQTDGSPQWIFTIKVGSGTYPYRCQFTENTLWKIRNLFVAAGYNVGKQRVNVDPNRVVGREIAVSLDDHEYNGRVSSEIMAVFPISELEDEVTPEDDEVEEEAEEEEEEEEDVPAEVSVDEDEEEEEEPAPPPKKKKKAKVKVPAVEEEEDELEELDIEDM